MGGTLMYKRWLITGAAALIVAGCAADPDFKEGEPLMWKTAAEIPINQETDPKVDSIVNAKIEGTLREKLGAISHLSADDVDTLIDIIPERPDFLDLLLKNGLEKSEVNEFLKKENEDSTRFGKWMDKFYDKKIQEIATDAVNNASNMPKNMTGSEKTELGGVIAADTGVPKLLSNGCEVNEVVAYMLDDKTDVGKWLINYNNRQGRKDEDKVTDSNIDSIAKEACNEVDSSSWGGNADGGKDVTKSGAIDMLANDIYDEAENLQQTVKDDYVDKPISLGDVVVVPLPDDIEEMFPQIDKAISTHGSTRYKVSFAIASDIPLDLTLYMLFADGNSAISNITEGNMDESKFYNFVDNGCYAKSNCSNSHYGKYYNPFQDVDSAGSQGVKISNGSSKPLELPDDLGNLLVDRMRGTKTVAWRMAGVMHDYEAIKKFAVERPCESGKCTVNLKIRMKLMFTNSFGVVDSLSNLDL